MGGKQTISIRGRGPQKRIRLQALAVALYSLAALATPAFAQRFDDVISGVILGGCAGLNPTGNLAARCGAGIPGASGGSTTALSAESTPAQEKQYQRVIGPLNLYFSGDYERYHKNVTTFEPGYTNDIWRALLGADYSLNNNFLFGGGLRYAHDNGDFKGGGNFDMDSYGFIVHANYIPAPDWFLDTNAGYLRKNSSVTRAVFFDSGAGNAFIGNARGKPDGNEFQYGVNGGYDYHFQNVTVGPRAALGYTYNQIDSYGEHGNTGLELNYKSQTEHSLTSTLGAQGSIAFSTGIGVIVPQLVAEYLHEFLDPQRRIGFRFAEDLNGVAFRFENDKPDRNYFNLGAGVVFQLAHGIAPFINYRALVGYTDHSSHRVTAGVRVEF